MRFGPSIIFQVLHFPALRFGPSFSRSCIFMPWDLVRHFPGPTFSVAPFCTGTGTCKKVLVAKRKMFCCSVVETLWVQQSLSSQSASDRSLQQLNKYLEMDDDDDDGDDDDCLAFWHRNQSSPNKLVHPALRALSIAADSSAVERVFSVQGAVILSPYRARISESLLSWLIFLKCNESLLP